jgi:hypothetical protein
MAEVAMARHLLRAATMLPPQAMLPTRITSSPIIPHSSSNSNNLPTQVPTEATLLDMVNPSNMDTVLPHPVEQEAIPRREAMDSSHHPVGTKIAGKGYITKALKATGMTSQAAIPLRVCEL